MKISRFALGAVLGASLAFGPAAPVRADGSAVAAGILGGIIGGAIVSDQQKRKRVYRAPTVSSATRAANRETQVALNYFGFGAGTPDGVMGHNSRAAVSRYQAAMNYVPTGQLSPYERDFLINSYYRAQSGGAATSQLIAQKGPQGVLQMYRNEAMGVQQVQPAQPGTMAAAPMPAAPMPAAPQGGGQMAMVAVNPPAAAAPPPAPMPVAKAAPEAQAAPKLGGLPSFMASGGNSGGSLNSHCNKVSLLTNSNGGFTTVASMNDPEFVLSEQFCLARTYAITAGEDLVAGLQGVTPEQVVQQCAGFGPAMKPYVSALSLEPRDAVLRQVGGFILDSGMSPAELAGTAKVCLSAGYRTDDMDVAIGSALILDALGDRVYGELIGHHLSQGYGTSKRSDLAGAWYESALDALDAGAPAAFAPGQPERPALLRAAALGDMPALPKVEQTAAEPSGKLPTFQIQQ